MSLQLAAGAGEPRLEFVRRGSVIGRPLQPDDLADQVIIAGVSVQEGLERANQSAETVAGCWERPRCHEHDTNVPAAIRQSPRAQSHEVTDVLGDDDAPLPGRRDEHIDVLGGPELSSFRDSHDIVSTVAERPSYRRRQVLIEEQPHPSASATLRCLASSFS